MWQWSSFQGSDCSSLPLFFGWVATKAEEGREVSSDQQQSHEQTCPVQHCTSWASRSAARQCLFRQPASQHQKGNKCRKKSQSASKGLGWPLQEQSPGPAWQGALQQPPEGSNPEHHVLPELVCTLPARAQLGQSTWQQLCEGYLP